MHWLDFLFPPRVDERVLRKTSQDDFLTLVDPRIAQVTRPETTVLLPFNDVIVRSAIHEAKYHGSSKAFSLLALALSEYLREFDDSSYGLHKSIIMVPIPLGNKRLKERGFNQTEEVVKRVPPELYLNLDNLLLERVRETESQVSLAREKREENMQGAFKATRHTNKEHIYVLIDDVLTTGATMQSAIDALKEVGTENIIPLALAH